MVVVIQLRIFSWIRMMGTIHGVMPWKRHWPLPVARPAYVEMKRTQTKKNFSRNAYPFVTNTNTKLFATHSLVVFTIRRRIIYKRLIIFARMPPAYRKIPATVVVAKQPPIHVKPKRIVAPSVVQTQCSKTMSNLCVWIFPRHVPNRWTLIKTGKPFVQRQWAIFASKVTR